MTILMQKQNKTCLPLLRQLHPEFRFSDESGRVLVGTRLYNLRAGSPKWAATRRLRLKVVYVGPAMEPAVWPL